MASPSWRISGDYFETCNCDFVCPCPTSHLTAKPTHGDCRVAFAFRIKDGSYGDVALDGISFATVALTPGPMGEGNWTVGVIVDEAASDEQRDALTQIASGAAGGPMARLSALVGTFAGVETAPISFEADGMTRAVKIGDFVDQAVQGMAGANQDEPMYFDNLGHPASTRLALAKSTRSHIHAFGIDFDAADGGNNGHFAPFDWQGP
jgi:hypothetical protein